MLSLVLDISWQTILIVSLPIFLQVVASGLRWNWILKCYKLDFPFLTIMRIQFASLFASLFLPATIGVGVGKMLLMVRAAPPLKVFESIVLDRLFALLSLALICLVSTAFMLHSYPETVTLIYDQILIASLLAGTFVLLLFLRKTRRYIGKFGQVLNELPRMSMPLFAKVTLASLVTTMLTVVAFALVAQNSIQDLNMWKFAILIPPVMMASALPISFNGWGVREAVSVVLFGLIGIPDEQALVISIQFGTLSMLPSVLGALCWFFIPPGQRDNRYQEDPSDQEEAS